MFLEAKPFLPDNFRQIIPSINDWIESLNSGPMAAPLQDAFSRMEVFHIMGLFMIGSAVILTSLRLIGVGLVEAPASLIYRNTRWLMAIGIVMAIFTGLLMGLSGTASKLYTNSAFLFKMVAMVAGILFSYLVMRPVAKADGAVGGGARIGLVIAMALWILSLAILITKKGSNAGAFHLIWAGGLIVFFAMSGARRWIMAGGALLILAAWQVVSHVIIPDGPTDAEFNAYMNGNKAFMWISAAWVVGAILIDIFAKDAKKDSTSIARLIGYATILVWVTVGVGGRWIGLT